MRTVLDQYAAMNRGDFEALRAIYTEDVVYDLSDLPDRSTHRGIEEVLAFLGSISDAVPVRNQVEQIAVEGDRVAAFVTLAGRAKASEMDVAIPAVHVWEFRGDRIAKHEFIAAGERIAAERRRLAAESVPIFTPP